jgi:hypothetical protein
MTPPADPTRPRRRPIAHRGGSAAYVTLPLAIALALWPAACWSALVSSEGPTRFVSKPFTVDVIGTDSTGHRLYYLATAVSTPDSLHILRCFELTSSRPQEARTLIVATRGDSTDRTLTAWVQYLQRICVPLDSVTAPGPVEVQVVGRDSVPEHDVLVPGYRLLLSQGIGARRYRAYGLCHSADLSVRAVLAVRGRPEALAVLEMPREGCEACNPMMLVLLSRRALPVRTLDPSLGP